MKSLTLEQRSAIKNVQKALKALKKADVYLFGMDDSILYVTGQAMKEAKKNDPDVGTYYNQAADTYKVHEGNQDRSEERSGTIVTSGVYIDSGGW